MKYFWIVCKGEFIKQRKNYMNSLSGLISLLIWPIITFFTTYYTYHSFEITELSSLGMSTKEQLLIFLVTGTLGYNCFFSMIESAFQILNERQNGTLEIIYLTPANRMAILYGRALGGIWQSLSHYSLFFLVILLINVKFSWQLIGIVFLCYLILFFSATIWGGMINVFFVITRDASILFAICDEPMNFFSGVRIPVSTFPFIFKFVSALFPLTYCLKIIRTAILNESNKFNFEHYVFLLINIVVIVLITYGLNYVAEIRNRKTGNLQLY